MLARLIKKPFKRKILTSTLKILVPLYTTYLIFLFLFFWGFLPMLRDSMTDQKRMILREVTENTLSLLTDYANQVRNGQIPLEKAMVTAKDQISRLRYGRNGEGYFWIGDAGSAFIMHPFCPDLVGTGLKSFKDCRGEYALVSLMNNIKQKRSLYTQYAWPCNDDTNFIEEKMAYAQWFPDWNWIVGAGLSVEDLNNEIQQAMGKFTRLFWLIFLGIIGVSFYISVQVYRSKQKHRAAVKQIQLEDFRLRKLFALNQMTKKTVSELVKIALEDIILLTESHGGYLALFNQNGTMLAVHSLSASVLACCDPKEEPFEGGDVNEGFWNHTLRLEKTTITNGKEVPFTGPHALIYPEAYGPVRRTMTLPVYSRDKMVALVGVANKGKGYMAGDARQFELMVDGVRKILEKKVAEDKIKESESRYRLLADNATDGIWMMTIEGFKFTYVSPSMESLFRYSAGEMVSINLNEILKPSLVSTVIEDINRELNLVNHQSRKDLSTYKTFESEIIRKDGSRGWAEFTVRFICDDSGCFNRILGIARDITRQKKMLWKLKQSNEQLRLAQYIAGLGSWGYDPETGAVSWSEEVHRIFEHDPEQEPLSAFACQGYVRKSFQKQVSADFKKIVNTGAFYDNELKLEFPSGHSKWVHVICKSSQKGPKGFLLQGTIQDITQRKKLEKKMQQTCKMEALGTLSAGIVHDFNNILSAILGYTELARQAVEGNKTVEDKLDKVLKAGVRARDLVRQILLFSSMSDGEKKVVGLAKLIQECTAFIKTSVPSNIRVQLDIMSPKVQISADPNQMHQVLMNILTNSVYAMEENGGILSIQCRAVDVPVEGLLQRRLTKPGAYVELNISDTGCGISEQNIERVFEPFFTTKPIGEGTGMGLSTAFGIIRNMGGSLQVDSVMGQGTCFKIMIPSYEDKGSPTANSCQAPQILQRTSGRVLVVDDEPTIVEITSDILTTHGFEVAGVACGRDALNLFRQSDKGFDLVITDYNMPGMTGLEVGRAIKKEQFKTKTVLCTGSNQDFSSEIMNENGIDMVLYKPVRAKKLVNTVHKMLNQ